MRLSDDFLSDLRFRNPIEDVISQYVDLKTAGNTMKGLCPFHNEKTASFTVYPSTASYYCFGCQNGGDVITFVRQIENLDYLEAVKLLADKAGMSMPESGYDDSREKLRKTILKINKETARFYHKCLMDKQIGAKGYAYFKERMLTDKTIAHFGLGFAPDSGFALCNHLKSMGFNENDMYLADIARKSKNGRPYDRFRGKMMFPIIDLRGNVIAFGGRKFPGEEGGKYINTGDTPVYKKSKSIFALNFAKNDKSDALILCEGYMDVIALHQAGFENAVAALGTSFTEEQAGLLSRYAKEIIVTMDSDAAGQKATRRAIGILNNTGIKTRVLQIEGGKDPDEFIKAYGAEKFRSLLDGAKNDIEFRLFGARAKFDMDTDDGKLQFVSEAVDILSSVNNEIAEELYAGRIAAETGIDKRVLLSQIKSRKSRLRKTREKEFFREVISPKSTSKDVNPEAKQHKRAALAEEYILSIMMNDPALCDEALNLIDESCFVTSFNKRVFSSIKSAVSGGLEFSIVSISGSFSPEEMGKISQIYNNRISGGNDVLLSCIATLKSEKQLSSLNDSKNLTDEQFEQLFKHIKDKK